MVAKNAVEAGIWAGICGELASDVTLLEDFINYGFSEFSVSPAKVLEVRKKLLDIRGG
jgi:phosphotransferase system enzyme I (PtsI)